LGEVKSFKTKDFTQVATVGKARELGFSAAVIDVETGNAPCLKKYFFLGRDNFFPGQAEKSISAGHSRGKFRKMLFL
jgi:hypothetical protein